MICDTHACLERVSFIYFDQRERALRLFSRLTRSGLCRVAARVAATGGGYQWPRVEEAFEQSAMNDTDCKLQTLALSGIR